MCVYTFVPVHVQSRDTVSYVALCVISRTIAIAAAAATTSHRRQYERTVVQSDYANMPYIFGKKWRQANPAVICAVSNKSVHLFALTFNR